MIFFGWVIVIIVAIVLFSKLKKNDVESKSTTRHNEHIDDRKITNVGYHDEFLNTINKKKIQLENEVNKATETHKIEMGKKYSDDMKVKETLSKFAKDHELDQALIALWEEIQYYSASDDKKQYLLNLDNIHQKGKNREDKEISFRWKDDNFSIKYHESSSFMSEDPNADFTLTENGEEKFKINTSHPYSGFGETYYCFGIDIFKKSGNWADFLLYTWEKIQIKNRNMHEDFKYIGAEDIKKKFEE